MISKTGQSILVARKIKILVAHTPVHTIFSSVISSHLLGTNFHYGLLGFAGLLFAIAIWLIITSKHLLSESKTLDLSMNPPYNKKIWMAY